MPEVDVPGPDAAKAGHALTEGLEERLRASRERLVRLAGRLGVPTSAAEDVAQEALLAAWSSLAHLRSAERFDAWLNAICRNQARMYLRAQRSAAAHQGELMPFGALQGTGGEMEAQWDLAEWADLSADDPLEVALAADRGALLTQALTYLAPHARQALEARYLAELSEAEAAAALGVGTPVLKARLHRGRQQLRQLLTGPLRAAAEGYDLPEVPPAADGWQETRLWCYRCGRRRLRGTFERLPEGRVELRLRCAECSPRLGMDIHRSKGIAPLVGMRAFRPALTRSLRALAARTERGLESGWDVCLHCGAPVRRRVVAAEEYPAALHAPARRYWVVAECATPGCPGLGAWPALEPAVWFHAQARHFMAANARWISLPEDLMEWQGRETIRFCLVSLTNAARVTFFADAHSLRVLAAFEE